MTSLRILEYVSNLWILSSKCSSRFSGTIANNTARRVSSDGLACPLDSYSTMSDSNLSKLLLIVDIVDLEGLRILLNNLMFVQLF